MVAYCIHSVKNSLCTFKQIIGEAKEQKVAFHCQVQMSFSTRARRLRLLTRLWPWNVHPAEATAWDLRFTHFPSVQVQTYKWNTNRPAFCALLSLWVHGFKTGAESQLCLLYGGLHLLPGDHHGSLQLLERHEHDDVPGAQSEEGRYKPAWRKRRGWGSSRRSIVRQSCSVIRDVLARFRVF